MKKLTLFLTIIFSLITCSLAQTTSAEKFMLYETAKKNGTTAVVLSCLLSSTGHAYAGNWGRGLLFTAARIGCAVFALTVGTETKTEQVSYYYTEQKVETTPAYTIGMVGALVVAIWEMVDANNEVKKYNAKLYEKIFGEKQSIGLRLMPKVDRNGTFIPNMTISYNF
ncbi:hypothetical protein ACX8XN_06680 [Calditrichota bacterium GD2]